MNSESSNSTEHTKNDKTLWVFTPSRTDPEDLEFILVQRKTILQDAVERVRESALTDHKHHLLFVGPRGCGKTHLVTLIVNRLSKDDDLADRLRIAWLNEDETCITLLDLLLKIHAALAKRYPDEYHAEMVESVFGKEEKDAVEQMSKHLLSFLGSRTLLVVAENLDAIFDALKNEGQKQLRAFIQEHPKFCIVATAQRLVEDLSDRTSPFFGFFQTEHLKPLSVAEAIELLQNIARLQGKTKVVDFLSTSRGRSRVRALHHLSGGNHRIYIVLSQFITRDSIDTLLELFLKMVDELTPYYQERIRWLPPLQRKIIEYLCTVESTVPVKDIATKLFTTPQSVSSQLQDLREKGYVEANARGRESLYEISEPLMRICVEVKDVQRHQPLRLLVDFLRVWYDDHELKHRLEEIKPTSASCAYLESAISKNRLEGNLRKQIFLEDLQLSLTKLKPNMRESLIRGLKTMPEEILLAMGSLNDGNRADALACINEAVKQETAPLDKFVLIIFRAIICSISGDYEKALKDYTLIIELSGVPIPLVALTLIYRGTVYGKMGNTKSEIEDYTAVIGLSGAPVNEVAKALLSRAAVYGNIGDKENEITDYSTLIALSGAPVNHVAMALLNRGKSYGCSGESRREIDDYTAIIALPGVPADVIAEVLVKRGMAYTQLGDTKREIEDFTSVIELRGAQATHVGMAFMLRGNAFNRIGEPQRAIQDWTAAIGLPGALLEQVATTLVVRSIFYNESGDTQRTIEDCTKVIGLSEVPAHLVAVALYLRATNHFKRGDKQKSELDLRKLISLPNAREEQVVDAHIALAELLFSEGKWPEGFQTLEAGLGSGAKAQPAYHGNGCDLIEAVFLAGLNPEGRRDKIDQLLNLYNKYHASPALGEAIVKHIGKVFQAGEPFPSADNLGDWALAWEQAAEKLPEFRLSSRLLRTAINFIKAGGKDRNVLLDLTSTERSILEQALGFVENEDTK